ncbi:ArsR family transcriptional regulator [Amycolatopsis panacis]|uniref:ArsR family transcriptional regulator n=1 Tax=Amycolatopsis panacis TaxID=2340917 RepID=A0A419HQY1_9PSEU|nr:ArsR family transcriptional regulator [Amycolatopsis panacis]
MQPDTCIVNEVDVEDAVFKALADPTRRALLDRLRERTGQTLGELCEPLRMTRQSATQHLGVLEAATLISTVRRGREKLHYLNPVPLWDIQERWIHRFERPRLRALGTIKERAERPRPAYRYVTYLETSPQQVWHALTDADLTARFWGHRNVSDWRPGSPWHHLPTDGRPGITGTVLESLPPRRLALTLPPPGPLPPAGAPEITFELKPYHEIVELTVTHTNLPEHDLATATAAWPGVCANLKSLLETGRALSRPPWEMHSGSPATEAPDTGGS